MARRSSNEFVTLEDCVCVGCGCTDSKACPNGCSWIVQSLALHIGVCSSCDKPIVMKKYVREVDKYLSPGRATQAP